MSESFIVREDVKVRAKAGVVVAEAQLSSQEGYILSRIENEMFIRDIYSLSFFDRQTTALIVKKLLDLGLIEPVGEPGDEYVEDSATVRVKRNYGGYVFNISDLKEVVDLDEDSKKETLFVFDHLDKMTYYELLRVLPNASKAEIRQAYHETSMLFHPDRYFRKSLGGYRVKLQEIFKVMNAAMTTLTHEQRRREYNQKLIQQGKLDEEQSRLDEDREREENTRREVEAQDRRLKNNPMFHRIQKAKEYYEAAMKDMESEPISAFNNLKLAEAMDPRNEIYQTLLAQISKKVQAIKAAQLWEKAKDAEEHVRGDFLQMFKEAADKAPNVIEYQLEYAKKMLSYGQLDEGLYYAKKAATLARDNPEANFLCAKILMSKKKKGDAVPYLEATLRLRKNHKEAEALLKEAKKSWF